MNHPLRFGSEVALGAIYFAIWGTGLAYGLIAIGVIQPTNFIYVYKYSMPFLLFWSLRSYELSDDQMRTFSRLLVGVFAFLSLYVFIHIVLVLSGLLFGSIRVAFPFTAPNENGFIPSDAPLYSAYLSVGVIALIFIRRLRASGITHGLFWGLLILSLGANLATGSRTGIVAGAAGFLILGLDEGARRALLAAKMRGVRPSTIFIVVGSLVVAAVAFIVLIQRSADQEYGVQFIITRALDLDFDLATDQSANARITKARDAFGSVWDHLRFIGIGMPSTTHDWFDIGISAIFFTGGILGTVVFFTILAVFVAKMHRHAVVNDQRLAFRALVYAFLSYGVSHIGAEYFLVTRSVVPFLLFIYLFSSIIERKRA